MDEQPVCVNQHLLPPKMPQAVVVPPEAIAEVEAAKQQGAENGNNSVQTA